MLSTAQKNLAKSQADDTGLTAQELPELKAGQFGEALPEDDWEDAADADAGTDGKKFA